MTGKTIFILIFTTCFWFHAKAVNSIDESINLNFYENSMAELIDSGFELIGYQFNETSFVSNIDLGGKTFSSITMGQALILNEKLTRSTPKDKYAGVINSKIKIEDIPLGEIQLYWRPSQSPFGMILSAFKYRLGRAFLLPQAPTEQSIQKNIHDYFVIKWQSVNILNTISDSKIELNFVKSFVLNAQKENLEVDTFVIQGKIIRNSDRKLNKVNYTFDLLAEQTGVFQCRNRIDTDFNPYSTDNSYLKGRTVCKTLTSQNTHKSAKSIK